MNRKKSRCRPSRFLKPGRSLFFIGIPCLLLNACTVGPDYVPPSMPVPEKWHNAIETQSNQEVKQLSTWWTSFHDPLLTQLVERAIQGNFDLKKALARITEARAQRGVANADYFPRVNSSGSVGENYNNVREQINGRYTLGFDASWEVNLFGQISRSVESAQATLEASEASYQDVMVSLVAEVGLNYLQMRTTQARLEVAQNNLAAQTQIHQLVAWRKQAGLATQLDAEQALASVQQLRSQISPLQNQQLQNQHQLALLLGIAPGDLHTQLSTKQAIPQANLQIALGIPADVLRQRPDVRQAERQLAAQTAQIGVATAQLYPKLTLSGSIGLDALQASQFFTTAGLVDSLLGRVTLPIFNAGAIRQNIAVQNARQEQALAQYETTVLTALKDVENALVGIAQEQQRRQDLTSAAQTAQRAFHLAQHQYSAGLADFQTVLQTQRTLLGLQDQAAQSQGLVASYFVNLYKALGGGWR